MLVLPSAPVTAAPTNKPTAAPTNKPTAAPTAAPTAKPTAAPTAAPTAKPTAKPTAAPTAAPVAPVVALGNVNCKKCADGAVAITNEATCKAAAAVLGKAYAGTEATPAKPKGCFVCTSTQQVKFNPVGDTANRFAQTVCQRTATVRSY